MVVKNNVNVVTINIKKIVIVQTMGEDEISIYPDLPTTHPEMNYDCCMKIKTRKNYAEEYVAENFPGIPPTVINTLA